MIRSWFGFNTAIATNTNTTTTTATATVIDTTTTMPKESLHSNEKPITMISTKVAPSVKATSVNVIVDDNVISSSADSMFSSELDPVFEPIRSASLSLSIELAKNQPSPPHAFMQKPDHHQHPTFPSTATATTTPQSSLPKSMMIHKYHPRPISIASQSSNSLLQRMAHSPKAVAATFSTSVSANGSVVHEDHDDNHRSAVVESLAKHVASNDLGDLTEDDIMNGTPSVASHTPSDEEERNEIQKPHSNADSIRNQYTKPVTEQESVPILSSSPASLLTPAAAASSSSPPPPPPPSSAGFWSWLGFPSSETTTSNNTTRGTEVVVTKQRKGDTQTIDSNNTMTAGMATAAPPSVSPSPPTVHHNNTTTVKKEQKTSSSWTSFLFSSKPSPVEKKPSSPPTLPSPSPPVEPSDNLATEDPSLRKVKSTSSLPSSPIVDGIVNNKPQYNSAAPSLRYASSASSFHQVPKRKNFVLPPFESQFLLHKNTTTNNADIPDTPPKSLPSTNLILKAMDAINSILIPPLPPVDVTQEDTSNWLAKRMRAKFSNFVEDLKRSSSAHDPIQSAMMDKRIVIVGVHGWFPMKLVRSMIGEPTGTSMKFCEQMAAGIKLYFKTEHQVTLPDGAITMVPLEGEGKVEDRVNQLYAKLLDNSKWLEAVSSADVILWATHSQGTPVSVMLLQRLLERGHIHLVRQSVSVLAMAGISHGPFPALKGSLIVKYFEADAARELFEFMDSTSPISVKFYQSLAYILKSGIKVVLTGSMQDQVVPLYSAIMSSVNHPNILRSIYIDGHIYSENDFLINLIVFALRLRNSGLSDHDLLIHLSEVLAGSLYALEGGHSTIYEELSVYMTAVRYTFETAPFGNFKRRMTTNTSDTVTPPSLASAPQQDAVIAAFQAKLQLNPFYLPWSLHAICTDPLILADELLRKDLSCLLDLFEVWNPTSARLRELKFRLDPIRTIKL